MRRRFSRRKLLRAGVALAVGAAIGPGFPTQARETDSIPLVAGLNTHSWCGPDTPIAEATAGLPLQVAYGWGISERRWLAYAPGTPVNTIGLLRHGQPLMLQMTADADWRQPRFGGAMPEPVELPVGWSFLGWSGLHETVWTAFGQRPLGSVAEARRWNTELQEWIGYTPGQSAEHWFAVLHPGDAVWVRMRIAGARWNPAAGVVEPDRAARLVPGEITYYHPSLAGGVMFCPPHDRYDPSDLSIGAAVTWPCGTRLRIWRDDRFVDVIVQDTGLLGHNHVDLSEAAFQRLAILPEGRVSVLIEVLAGPE
ncbi:MAG: hypothetical protein F4W96_06075 [Chloroflexi bacterium]|nr:hypothetical protein [Chloroflexota bacterium]